MDDREDTWRGIAQEYCARVGRVEHEAWLKRRKPRKSDRFQPSEYLREMCRIVGYGTEEEFKARKMLEGYSSSIGV